jgi:hypothetical protein
MLSFVRVMPVAGVTVSVDSAPSIGVGAGSSLGVDARAHVLRFGCVVEDACEPETRAIAPGSAPQSLAVELRIRPATLLVLGSPDDHYFIEDFASLEVRAGVPVRVPVAKAVNNYVTVIDRDTKRAIKVNLSAGRESRASFGP